MSDIYLLTTSFWSSGLLLVAAYFQVRYAVEIENSIEYEPWERI